MATAETVYYDTIYFHAYGTLTAANGKWPHEMPADFEILAWGGFAQSIGTGAGLSIDIQLRNATKTPDLDYFSTKPTIEVNTATGLVEGGALIAEPQGQRGDILWLDIDAVPGGTPSNLEFWILCRFFRRATD